METHWEQRLKILNSKLKGLGKENFLKICAYSEQTILGSKYLVEYSRQFSLEEQNQGMFVYFKKGFTKLSSIIAAE